MKILLTGSSGYLGSELAKSIRESTELELILFDRNKPFEYEEIDVLINCGAHGVKYPHDTLRNLVEKNYLFQRGYISKLIDSGSLKRIIQIGSCWEYGLSLNKGPVTEFSEEYPIDPYSISKFLLHQWLVSECKSREISYLNCRVFHLFGGRTEPEYRFYSQLRTAALSGSDFEMSKGEIVRDFVRIEDAVSQILVEVRSDKQGVKFIASGKSTTLAEFAQKHWSQFQATGKLMIGALDSRENEIQKIIVKKWKE